MISSNESSTIGNQDDYIEIEITDVIEEWGYDAPPEDENRDYFADVAYTLKMEGKDIVKTFSFYSSEIKNKDNFTIDLERYKILILSDKKTKSSAQIEMIISKNKSD